ncbi:hypothetical protein FOXG_18595 [Fusarium oxysporum f. sp. lycopersici 4287]|uniref:Uncharacterized protein n=2 Tax=Fusarium oxysporum TaxID=5507 RepID=A0A0J9ULQ2_FUSO4|nr:hypothetical protein FOXG_18595 [Fusarium oxysporum f. sp. lycopersici 4287]XP_018237858.1 hypothetical protein FOXG_18595 [Fusarium oxysporum f. sp. lycopersici 4287]EXK31357.1 hypothetical protein FOMG_13065 [Fusarium oxysporum f. sp. melonis 26406]EXK31358.1 hypothetical protein FOMG_13065 [Fusarium oxysporum f. sp. melonis 26406]KNA99811.1 hypothetical protein FOXG_18595 [Fusarium oxysporum f. sp. lycopersici 4287]KNA99812.1 hypothetical protein FOXG_18595 [Fusarium oxysporum f. sp. lyc
MSQFQYRWIFEYPHVGLNMVSESPPKLHNLHEPSDGSDLKLDPQACSHEIASDTDTDDDLGDSKDVKHDDPGSDNNQHSAERGRLHPHALHFLAQVPQSDADWSRYLCSNADVRSLCHRLKLPYLFPGFRAHLDWPRFFNECTWHLAQACNNPPLGSLFSLVFVAACHVALIDGCPREEVYNGLRACVRQCCISEDEVTPPMLDRMREGVITGIGILREYSKVVGCRANEIPLHAHNCLQVFQCCNPACIRLIKEQISSAYRPTTPLDSEYLEIPSLVYEVLGGRHSKWGYEVIYHILCPRETASIYVYGSVDMTRVMEFEERDDLVEWDGSLDTELACVSSIADD